MNTRRELVLRVINPCDVANVNGTIIGRMYGIISDDGWEQWDVESAFATREEAEARPAELAADGDQSAEGEFSSWRRSMFPRLGERSGR
jgi:hypothetical protein